MQRRNDLSSSIITVFALIQTTVKFLSSSNKNTVVILWCCHFNILGN